MVQIQMARAKNAGASFQVMHAFFFDFSFLVGKR